MKATTLILLLASLAMGFSSWAAEQIGQTRELFPASPATLAPATNTVNPETPAPALLTSSQGAAAPTNVLSTNLVSAEVANPNLTLTPAIYNPKDGLRMNFRNVPLDMVLNYLGEAAGFIIIVDTPVSGKVDVWSNTPVTKDEAVSLLNTVLNKNNYAAIRNGRTLRIVSRDTAKTQELPVKRGAKPDDIPKNDEIVTQIIPIQYINAAQLVKDLKPLLPLASELSANEAGNALVLTDSQGNIHRMTEIIAALDMPADSRVSIRVKLLKFADAKTIAGVIKDLFTSQDQRGGNANDPRMAFIRMRMGMGGPGGGAPGGGGDAGAGAGGNPRAPTPKVTATSDDRSNAVIVSAPEDVMPTIDNLLEQIDTEVEEVTEVRVFRLKYADPVEMSDLLTGLFPDDTRSNNDQGQRGQVRFGGGNFGARGNPASASPGSDRMKKMGRVISVPDQRTASVIVSAARDLMVQIAAMIEQLDSNPAKKQKVYVYSVENADVQQVEQLLHDMFDRTGTANNRNNNNQNNALNSRSTANSQNMGRSTGTGTSFGTSSGNRGVGGGNGGF